MFTFEILSRDVIKLYERAQISDHKFFTGAEQLFGIFESSQNL